jgi:uncharacterized protein
MIKMQVMGIALDTKSGTPIIVLSDQENRRALPIWIGTAEASAMIRQMENIKTERPMTHDLICNLLETLGYTVEKIEINDINSSTYYANIFLKDPAGKTFNIDSRPSDAIVIAMKTGSDIFIAPKVVAEGTISTNEERDEVEAEEFRKFVSDIKPSDFQKIIDKNKESNQ